jgi:hypothetical protein
MRKLAVILLLISTATATLLAQPSDVSDFWKKAPQHQYDAAGKLLRAEERDPKSWTVKTFDSGRWTVLTMQPGTERIVRMETGDTSAEYGYDSAGIQNSLTVYVDGLALTAQFTADGQLSVEGLPVIVRDRNHNGQVTSIRALRGPAYATYRYRQSGHLSAVTLASGISLEIGPVTRSKATVTETLRGHDGKVRRVLDVERENGQGRTYANFDAVKAELGLTKDVLASLVFKGTESGQVTRVWGKDGKPVFYFLNVGPDRVVFNDNGRAIFYDLEADFHEMPAAPVGNSDTGMDPMTDLAAVAPDRLVVSAKNSLGTYISSTRPGVISSLWTEGTDKSNISSHYTVMGGGMQPATKEKVGSPAHATDSSLTSPRRRLLVRPELTIENQTTTCWDSPGGSYCEVTTMYTYFPDSGGGSSGGSGSSSGANQVIGDAAVYMAVNRGLTQAATKLAQARCSALLGQLTGVSGYPLSTIMQTRHYTDPVTYMTGYMVYKYGGTSGPCAGGTNAAYTQVNGNTVNVCAGFDKFGETMDADLLIHEMLHSLGMPERPGYASAQYTSPDITSLVVAACGP